MTGQQLPCLNFAIDIPMSWLLPRLLVALNCTVNTGELCGLCNVNESKLWKCQLIKLKVIFNIQFVCQGLLVSQVLKNVPQIH